MKKLLLALLILLATSTLAQQQDVAPLQISTSNQTPQKPVIKRQPTLIDERKHAPLDAEKAPPSLREQLPAQVQQKLLDIEKNDMDRRVEYLQHQQTIFFSIFSVVAALAIFGIGYFLNKNLGEKYQNKEREMESRMQLLENTITNRLANLDMQVALSQKSVEETQLKINKAVDDAVNKAVERVQEKTDERTEAFSEQVKIQIENAQKALKEINATKNKATKEADKVSRLLKEIEENKGKLTPKLQEEIKEQVEKTEKEKNESEYTAEDWFLKGLEASESGNNEDASTYFEKSHHLAPENANILCNWGTTLSNMGLNKEAIKKFEKAIKIKSNHYQTYNNWGALLGAQSQHQKAIEKFEKALEIEPNYINSYMGWNLALSLLQTSNPNLYSTSLQEFKDVLEKNKDIPKLRDNEEFQKIYNEHFPTETPAEKPKTSPKKGKDEKKKK